MMLGMAAAKDRQLAWVSASSLVLIGAAAMALPAIGQSWGERPWFEAVFLAGVFLLDIQIALFLALQALAAPPSARALAWLGGGYAFAAVAAAAMFFSLPDIVEPLGIDREGLPAVSQWLWTLWHAGFPCFVLLALQAKARSSGRPRDGVAARPAFDLYPLAVGIGVGLAGVAATLAEAKALPLIGTGGDIGLTGNYLGAAVAVLNVFALMAVVYMTRLREVLYLWLALAVLAFTLDVLLSLAGIARYTVGWYVGHGLSLASASAVMGALLIENFRLHRDAEIRAAFHEQEAMHDPLTGLFNRRYLMEKLVEELGRAERYRYPVSVLMIDADHFKSINDENGHGVGDECLRALARAMVQRVHRFGDYSARYGGEEFVVVLPECNLLGAIEVAEEIRRRVEDLHARGAAPLPLTVSIGAATAPFSTPQSAEALLATADECLYRAKRQGRNRVAWPQEPAAPHGLQPTPI
ncbi:MAG TPA: sensor domain-containing diguanylate cyclase [Rhodocyclaceae bacterium]